ncbi:DUF4280 domain-containing protein [Azospirillum sp. A1-3]|uniref:DUF4280 domain-containing protein n=1 Tax=Azospirillum sp. A1-3 TaxID=185874 RepID=UPI0020775FA2|nr:DUF4280 domain-containing protein [Azospirillum sp. A1-3]MCM8738869.1 DUF4280 domain-containing protein [Azospirillum sp. A1-3]
MPFQVVNTATLQCSFGLAPAVLTVLAQWRELCGNQPAANIMDHKPLVNIGSFGMCTSLANPTVASATAAAMGALTPMPCIPATMAPWVPGSPTVILGTQPALNNSSKCMCNWGGVLSIVNPGQMTTQIP